MVRVSGGRGWPLDKSLCLIPESFRWALVYGRNPFTGRETPPWRVRNVVRWARPNPPVGSLGDKVRPATSDMVIACTSRTRYFDLDAVRTEHAPHTLKYNGGSRPHSGERGGQGTVKEMAPGAKSNPAGAPPLDWWEPDAEEQAEWDRWADDLWVIPTAPYKGSHYATWPPMLCVRPIEAMVPHKVCTVCGEPSRRIVEGAYLTAPDDSTRIKKRPQVRGAVDHPPEVGWERSHTTVGWTDCGHGDNWRTGVVLDCFGGSGTTGAVATGHGRNAVLVDLDERNAALAQERLGMFMDVDAYHPDGSHLPDWLVTPTDLGGARASA
jgi:site-specific DNA-methyltransferase (adenine-specific)